MGKAEAGSDPLAKVAAMSVTVPTETISNMSPCVAGSLNKFTTELRRLFLVEDMVDTIKFGLSLWLLTYIGSWFNMLTLIILVVLLSLASYSLITVVSYTCLALLLL